MGGAKAVEGVGEQGEALLQHHPAEEQHHHIVVGEALGAAPVQIAAGRIEQGAVDATAPDPGPVRPDALVGQGLRHRGGRGQDVVAALVEAEQALLHHRLQPAQAVVGEIGLKPGVQAGHHRRAALAGQLLGLEAQQVGRRQVDDVGGEGQEVLARRRGQAQGQPVLGPAGQADGGNGDQVSRHRRIRRGGGVDAHPRALDLAQVVHQAGEGLGGAVARVVVVAGEQGDAKRANH